MQPHIRAFVERAVTFTTCPDCGGSRLNEAARSSKIEGINIADACAMQISDLAEWVRGLDEPSVAPLLAALRQTLDSFVEIGLGYLSLDRPSGTLSGGEAQRTKMIRQLGSSLTDVTYVFDEPTIGLHPHDIAADERPAAAAARQGQHRAGRRAQAGGDRDRRPRRRSRPRRRHGGRRGGVRGHASRGCGRAARSPGGTSTTGPPLKPSVRTPSGVLEVRGAEPHNLQDVDVDIPLGVLVVVTGVAGSGKSSLIDGSVSGRDGVVSVDQAAIKGSRRSNPATYTGLLDPIRKAFAKANGVKPALFSANSEGACPNCNGAGVDLHRPGDDGRRRHRLRGVRGEAVPGRGPGVQARREGHQRGARDVGHRGRGVLRRRRGAHAGRAQDPRPASPTSGSATSASASRSPRCRAGERQRLKLATHMAEKGGVYVLDEPTAGLHLADVEQLLGLLDRLVDSGKSVIVIEHHQAVMAHADWIIDLGPGAGHDGGRVVFEGTPADLVAARSTLTGEHLAAYVGA